MSVTLRELLQQEDMAGITVLAGASGLDRPVDAIMLCETPLRDQPWTSRVLYYLPPYVVPPTSPWLDVLIRRLSAVGASGLLVQFRGAGCAAAPREAARGDGASSAGLPEHAPRPAVPKSLLLLADRYQMPVLDLGPVSVMAVAERLALLKQNALLAAYQRLDAAISRVFNAWREGQAVESIVALLGESLNGSCRMAPWPGLDPAERDLPPVSWDEEPAHPMLYREEGRLHAVMVIKLRHRVETAYLIHGVYANRPHQDFVVQRLFAVAAPIIHSSLEHRWMTWEIRLRSKLDLIRELVLSTSAVKPEVVSRAREAGWDLSAHHTVALLRIPDYVDLVRSRAWTDAQASEMESIVLDILEQHARSRGWWAYGVAPEPGTFLVVLRHPDRPVWSTDEVRQLLLEAIQRVRKSGHDLPLSGGVGTTDRGIDGLRRSYRNAKHSLHLGYALRGSAAVVTAEEIGPERYLYGWYRSEDAQALIEALLGPVFKLPPNQRAAMLETVEALVRARGDVSRAAEILSLHRNTVRYRLNQFEKRTGIDVSDPQNFYLLGLALRAYRASHS